MEQSTRGCALLPVTGMSPADSNAAGAGGARGQKSSRKTHGGGHHKIQVRGMVVT